MLARLKVFILTSQLILSSLGFVSTAYAKSNMCTVFLRSERHVLQILNEFNFPEEFQMKTSNRDLRLGLYFAFGGRDFYTGEQLRFKDMSIDHVIPKSRGGPNNLFNYVPTNARLNSEKGDYVERTEAREVLEIIQSVYAQKVIREMEKLSEISNKVKARLVRYKDPRKVALNERGEIVKHAASFKQIKLITVPSQNLKNFLGSLRHQIRNKDAEIEKIGPSVRVRVSLDTNQFSARDVPQFQKDMEVKTQIRYKDKKTNILKIYPLIHKIKLLYENTNYNQFVVDTYLTRKFFKKLKQFSNEDFGNFLTSGVLVETPI